MVSNLRLWGLAALLAVTGTVRAQEPQEPVHQDPLPVDSFTIDTEAPSFVEGTYALLDRPFTNRVTVARQDLFPGNTELRVDVGYSFGSTTARRVKQRHGGIRHIEQRWHIAARENPDETLELALHGVLLDGYRTHLSNIAEALATPLGQQLLGDVTPAAVQRFLEQTTRDQLPFFDAVYSALRQSPGATPVPEGYEPPLTPADTRVLAQHGMVRRIGSFFAPEGATLHMEFPDPKAFPPTSDSYVVAQSDTNRGANPRDVVHGYVDDNGDGIPELTTEIDLENLMDLPGPAQFVYTPQLARVVLVTPVHGGTLKYQLGNSADKVLAVTTTLADVTATRRRTRRGEHIELSAHMVPGMYPAGSPFENSIIGLGDAHVYFTLDGPNGTTMTLPQPVFLPEVFDGYTFTEILDCPPGTMITVHPVVHYADNATTVGPRLDVACPTPGVATRRGQKGDYLGVRSGKTSPPGFEPGTLWLTATRSNR